MRQVQVNLFHQISSKWSAIAAICLTTMISHVMAAQTRPNTLNEFIYQGSNYDIRIGDELSVKVLEGNQWRPWFQDIYVRGYYDGWKQAYRQAKLKTVRVVSHTGNCTKVEAAWDTKWRNQGVVKMQFRLYPTYFMIDGAVEVTGPINDLSRQTIMFHYAPEAFNPQTFVGAPLWGVKVINHGIERFGYGSEYKTLPMTKGEGDAAGTFSIALIPWVGEQAAIAPIQMTGNEQEDTLGVGLPANKDWNIFFAGKQPYFQLATANYGTSPRKLAWNAVGKDMWGKVVFQTNGNEIIPPGKRLVKRVDIDMPNNWQGYMKINLAGESGGRQIQQMTRLGVIPTPYRAHRDESIFGMQTYVWSFRTDKLLDVASWAGVHWMRGIWHSSGKKLVKDKTSSIALWLQRHEERGLDIIPHDTDVTSFPAGTFRYSEGANEANHRHLAAEWAEKIKLNYWKLKRYDPNIIIGSSSMGGIDMEWLKELAENNGWNYFDAIVVHLHCFPYAPEVDNTITRYFWLAARVRKLKSLMDKYGYKPVLDTEQGYLENDPKRRVEKYPLRMITESDTAAAFLVRSYLEALAYGLKAKTWFELNDYAGFAIIDPITNAPRPSYVAYAVMTHELDGAKYAGELTLAGFGKGSDLKGPPLQTWFGQITYGQEMQAKGTQKGDLDSESANTDLRPRFYARAFKMPDGSPLIATWATLRRTDVINHPIDTPAWRGQKPAQDQAWNGQPIEGEPKPVPVTLDVGAPSVQVVDLMGNKRTVDCPGGKLTLDVNDYPQYILGADPSVLAEAGKRRLTLFPSEPQPIHPSPVVGVLLPPGGKFPRRPSVYDTQNLAATLTAGQAASFTVRVTNCADKAVSAKVKLTGPAAWRIEPAIREVTLNPGQSIETKPFSIMANHPAQTAKLKATISSDSFPADDSVLNIAVKPPSADKP